MRCDGYEGRGGIAELYSRLERIVAVFQGIKGDTPGYEDENSGTDGTHLEYAVL